MPQVSVVKGLPSDLSKSEHARTWSRLQQRAESPASEQHSSYSVPLLLWKSSARASQAHGPGPLRTSIRNSPFRPNGKVRGRCANMERARAQRRGSTRAWLLRCCERALLFECWMQSAHRVARVNALTEQPPLRGHRYTGGSEYWMQEGSVSAYYVGSMRILCYSPVNMCNGTLHSLDSIASNLPTAACSSSPSRVVNPARTEDRRSMVRSSAASVIVLTPSTHLLLSLLGCRCRCCRPLLSLTLR